MVPKASRAPAVRVILSIPAVQGWLLPWLLLLLRLLLSTAAAVMLLLLVDILQVVLQVLIERGV
jgi:hypothetical protein